jgi:hypothetical protein
MIEYGVVLFHTTSSVMRAEKLLVKKYSIKLIPTPRQFSSDCGIAIRFEWNDRERVQSMLNEAKVEFGAVHFLDINPA